MQVKDIILDPICILQMSTYFEKKMPKDGRCATFGLLYAQQVELKYKICWSVPLGNHEVQADELISRAFEYEKLRLTRSKTTVNFYEEYNLVGCYIMRADNLKQEEEKIKAMAADL